MVEQQPSDASKLRACAREAGGRQAPFPAPLLLAPGRRILIQDMEYRVIRCDALAVWDGRRRAKPDVRPRPGRETNVLLDDRCSTFNGDLFEPCLAPPTADDVGLALGSHVLHPLALPEHRHEILLTLVLRYDDRESVSWTPKMRQLAKVEPCP